MPCAVCTAAESFNGNCNECPHPAPPAGHSPIAKLEKELAQEKGVNMMLGRHENAIDNKEKKLQHDEKVEEMKLNNVEKRVSKRESIIVKEVHQANKKIAKENQKLTIALVCAVLAFVVALGFGCTMRAKFNEMAIVIRKNEAAARRQHAEAMERSRNNRGGEVEMANRGGGDADNDTDEENV